MTEDIYFNAWEKADIVGLDIKQIGETILILIKKKLKIIEIL